MREGIKAWLGLLAGVGAGFLYLQLTRDPEPPGPSPAPSPSRAQAPPAQASAPSPAPAAPPRVPATAAEVAAARKRLGELVRSAAGDPDNPWALAHGMVAFGPDFRTRDNRPAVEVIARHAVRGADGRLGFPTRAGSIPVEPHPRLLVKTLLETGVPLERELTVADGKRVTVRALAADALAVVPLPTTDAEWQHAAWTLSALVAFAERTGTAGTAGEARGTRPKVSPVQPTLDAWAEAALTRLEQDHAALGAGTAEATAAFAAGSPLRQAREQKQGIFGHSCGGFHLIQAVLSSVGGAAAERAPGAAPPGGSARGPGSPPPAPSGHSPGAPLPGVSDRGAGGDAGARRRRAQRQLGILLFRYEAERESLAALRAAHPEHALPLEVQGLKFLGHLLETVGQARTLGLYDAGTEGGRRLEALLHDAAGDLVRLVERLDASGVYGRLESLRPAQEQLYLDLVGDACHAIRGLSRVPD